MKKLSDAELRVPPDWEDSVSSVEINHRVANNLAMVVALVRLHRTRLAREGRSMTAAEASLFLEEVAARIETVARLHRLLSEKPDTDSVNVATYLQELCDTLGLSLPDGGTLNFLPGTDSRFEGYMVTPDQLLPLALIVTEAVTNAIKYAHPAGVAVTIDIRCRREKAGALVIEVEDDGVGLPEGLDPEVDGGLGFQAMRMLARQIEADLGFDSSPLGLRCTARLPRVESCVARGIRRSR
jgi:two-component sensor histidine kinase